jgi:hypothetical protein
MSAINDVNQKSIFSLVRFFLFFHFLFGCKDKPKTKNNVTSVLDLRLFSYKQHFTSANVLQKFYIAVCLHRANVMLLFH